MRGRFTCAVCEGSRGQEGSKLRIVNKVNGITCKRFKWQAYSISCVNDAWICVYIPRNCPVHVKLCVYVCVHVCLSVCDSMPASACVHVCRGAVSFGLVVTIIRSLSFTPVSCLLFPFSRSLSSAESSLLFLLLLPFLCFDIFNSFSTSFLLLHSLAPSE